MARRSEINRDLYNLKIDFFEYKVKDFQVKVQRNLAPAWRGNGKFLENSEKDDASRWNSNDKTKSGWDPRKE